MSKNAQMLSPHPVVIAADRRTRGPASIAQGVYGRRGNLELLACDAEDGLWVFWFNADLDTDPVDAPDVPPGTWSNGLRFATGIRYLDAVILQSVLGPDHLEVLALTDEGELESWFWSPGPGFQRREGIVAAAVHRFVAEIEGGVISVTADADGRERHLRSDAEDYPRRTWADASDGPAIEDDEHARRMLAQAGITQVGADTVRSTASTRCGGTDEIVWRDAAGELRHVGVPLV